jgi:hypothetical protein
MNPLRDTNSLTQNGHVIRPQTSYRSFAGNNRLRLTRALAAELDLWLKEILSHESSAVSQRKALIELLHLFNEFAP